MRVSFSIPLRPKSGKHKFAIRLSHAMQDLGVKTVTKKPDVNIVFLDGARKDCKNIFRLDGVWMNSEMNYKKGNKKLLKSISQCDGIVYQNQFCKDAADMFLGKPSIPYQVILNGVEDPDNTEACGKYGQYILTFARWRPHKRLKDTVNGFLNSDLEKDYKLIVCGEADYVINHDSVRYLGQVNSGLPSIIKGCSFAVHLAYCDWCPNSVAETLICGKNVLHSSVGGTKYLVKNNGIMIKEKDWNFKPIKLYSPPKLDMDKLAQSFRDMVSLPPATDLDHIRIETVAQQYIDFCKKVLS